ncbi:nucleotidyltransferase domain-containing protein [Halogeometricum sp. S1BR25-6]|uniref:Nucleotidyltransferase domain-containing protein n=1 Tax=Halogeometricum salsisoli TaxID=2950536 RepID=A0ABU2G9U3_9EURY|nr:nucleotidyltransferase domain-containing protein [Halogeometricum sp. S1BR25-6]MDS0297547.1 nucleotidyltransferase domain-containing protein [Halogeometricum sp. S1BR25-6]
MSMDRVDRDDLLDQLRYVLDEVDIDIDRAIVFGSVAREEHDATSDIDVIVVSADFEGVPGAHRGTPFRELWDYEEYGAFHDICYTPEEYDEYRERPNSLIKAAESEGIRLI